MSFGKLALLCAVVLAAPVASQAGVILFQDNFDADSSGNWSFNSHIASDAPDDTLGNEANHFFDYSTVGIPSAPNSVGGTTRGLMMQANVPGTAVFTGASTSPLNQSFTGDYVLRTDVWQNFPGPFPAGGTGSTQMTWAGVGTNGTTAQFPGTSVQGIGFAASGDGGTASDYRIYTNVGAPLAPATGAYAAGTQSTAQNNTDPYYAANGFGSETAPQDQLDDFPQQTGTTAPGTQGMAWHQWEITRTGNIITWEVDGVLMGTFDATSEPFGGDNFFLGQFDINATTADSEGAPLLFGLFDNVRVEVVPEPGTLCLLSAAGLLALRRRRK